MAFLPIEHSALTDDDIATLIDYIGAIDGHDHDSDIDFDLWEMAAQSNGWQRAEVVAGVLHLMRDFTGFLIKPPNMQQAVAEVRAAVRARWNPPDPPYELADNPRAEIEWRRAALRDFRTRAIAALAQGRPLEAVPMLSEGFAYSEAPKALPGSAAAVAAQEAMTAFIERSRVALSERGPGGAAAAARHRRPSAVDPVRAQEVREDLASRSPVPMPGDAADADA